MIESDKYFF